MYYNNNCDSLPGIYKIIKPRLSKIGKVFIGILLVVIFEGAFRKWISTSFTIPLILLRDAMALYGIFSAIASNRLKFSQIGAQILWFFSAVFVAWSLLQLIVNQSSPFIFIIGVRFWLFYLWFAYAAAVSLTEYDFDFITKIIILLLLVISIFSIIQHFLPPSAFLNKQLDDDTTSVFRLTANIVRPTSTFSFTIGNTTFLAIATPFVLTLLAPGTKLWGKKWLPKFFLLALGIATMVSGSRGALIFLGLLYFSYVIITLKYSDKSKKGATLLMVAVITVLLALVPYFFSGAVDATQERFESAAEVEDFSGRIFTIFFGEASAYESISLVGHGVGVGTNFAGAVATGERTFLLAETETARIIMEGGLLGFIYIGLKILVIVAGLRKSLSIAKSTGNALPLMLWITTSLAFLTWSIIGQLTVNALGYLLLALAIASLRLSLKK